MTAEIVVMNKNGVALAADSAVTVGGRKVYNSANKLFTLSKHHPVGILIYGSATFNDIPWEIIIKEYREQLKENSFDSLEKYEKHFQEFLSRPCWKSSTIVQSQHARNMLLEFADFFHEQYVANNSHKQTSSYTKAVFDRTVTAVEKILQDCTDKYIYTNVKEYELESSLQHVFQKCGITTSYEYIQKIVELFLRALRGNYSFFHKSGIAIAGYGKKDIYPALTSFETSGFICNHLRMFEKNPEKITDKNGSAVCPLAQRDMSDLFMSGIHPDYKIFISSQLKPLLETLGEEMISLKKPQDQGVSIRAAFKNTYKDLIQGIDSFSYKRFIEPKINSVGTLSKIELAKMAESLVELQAFGQQVSLDVETVGGPIDVAVISKHDGFVWLKRKLYFKPELNHCFFEKYLK